MNIVPFGEIPVTKWDDGYAGSPQTWLFHSGDWIAIEQRFFAGQNLSFALVDRDAIVGIQPLYFSDASSGSGGERLLHSGIHRHTGLALVRDLSSEQVAKARAVAMSRIFAAADQFDVDRIQLNAHNLTPESRSLDRVEIPFWVEHYGFRLGLSFSASGFLPGPGMATCNADQIVRLDRSKDELFANLDQKCRNAVRQAQRHELCLSVGAEAATVDVYYDLARASAQRTGEALAPLDYYREIWRRLHSSGRCAVLFIRHGDRLAAGLFLLIDKGAASYLGGVSDPELLRLRPNNLLHWSAMLWAREQGMSHYRFGPIFPEVPADWPIARVSRFKGQFGGRSMTVIQGSYFRRPEQYLEPAIAHLRELCRPVG